MPRYFEIEIGKSLGFSGVLVTVEITQTKTRRGVEYCLCVPTNKNRLSKWLTRAEVNDAVSAYNFRKTREMVKIPA